MSSNSIATILADHRMIANAKLAAIADCDARNSEISRLRKAGEVD